MKILQKLDAISGHVILLSLTLSAAIIMGGVVIHAAGSSPSVSAGSTSPAVIMHAQLTPTVTLAKTPVAIVHAAKVAPALTPTPTQAPTPAPSPTPMPKPTPSPTPAPSWHTIATFSGNTAGVAGTVSPTGPWRVFYTCGQAPTPSGEWSLWVNIPWYGGIAHGGAICGGSYPTSGQYIWGVGDPLPAGTYELTVAAGSPPEPIGPWTLTVESWY